VNDEDEGDSILIVPNKKVRQAAIVNGGPGVEYVPHAEDDAVDTTKKKKR
jgi:hypothetical protein